MLELSLHILDIVENSTRAGARNVRIEIHEDIAEDRLIIDINDDGEGMDEDTLRKALDPFFTTKKVRRVGLGLPMLAEAAERTGGRLTLESREGRGTRVRVEFGYSHIDRQPLGDMPGTILALIAGNPEVNFTYCHRRNGLFYRLDTSEIKEEIGDIPVNHTEVLKFIRETMEEGLKGIGFSRH